MLADVSRVESDSDSSDSEDEEIVQALLAERTNVNKALREGLIELPRERRQYNKRKRIAPPKKWDDWFRVQERHSFKTLVRMTMHQFSTLWRLVEPNLKSNHKYCGKERRIDGRIKLASVLMYLGGGRKVDISTQTFNYSPDYFNVIFKEVYHALRLTFCTSNLLDNFKNPEYLEKLSNGFKEEFMKGSRRWMREVFTDIIGCVDGCAIAMKYPGIANKPEDYKNHKGFYALILQAMCDAKSRITFYDLSSCGKTHDSVAWNRGKLAQAIESGDALRGRIDKQYFILGDAAYRSREAIVTPFPLTASALTGDEKLFRDSFNFYQSSLRMVIECSFGRMANKFRILGRKLDRDLKGNMRIVEMCILLHNFCIDHRTEDFPSSPENSVEVAQSGQDVTAGARTDEPILRLAPNDECVDDIISRHQTDESKVKAYKKQCVRQLEKWDKVRPSGGSTSTNNCSRRNARN